MSQVTIQVSVQKEVNDVASLVAAIIVGLAAKKPITQIAAEELVALETAVSEVMALPGDVKADLSGSLKGALNPMVDAIAALVAPPAPSSA